MNDSLTDEILSINAIYGDNTLVAHSIGSQTCLLHLPSLPGPSFKLSFPSDYPESPPKVLGTETLGSSGIRAGQGKDILERIISALGKVYQAGSCCIYDLIEECNDLNIQTIKGAESPEENNAKHQQQHSNITIASNNTSNDDSILTWTLSEPVTEKKSVFIARVATVYSPTQARAYLDHLLATDKKVGRATHNINAWRIRGGTAENNISNSSKKGTANTTGAAATTAAATAAIITYQDSDDDGETAAGSRLLHLLQLMHAWNVIVVVSRWYGGVHLGPDRFRLINAVAREALVKAGVAAGPGFGFGPDPDARNANSRPEAGRKTGNKKWS